MMLSKSGSRRPPPWRLSLIVLMAAAGGVLAAGSVRAETLEDALVAAYGSNPDLEGQRASLRATDEGVPIAQAGWLPTIQVSANYGYSRFRSASSGIVLKDHLNPFGASLTGTQTIFDGQTYYAVRQAKATVRAGRASLDSVEQNVLLAVVTSYMDVLRDIAVLDLRRNNVTVLRRQLDATRDRFNVGELTRTDVSQAEARLASAISALTGAEAQLTSSRESYARLVGHQPGTLQAPPPLPILPKGPDEALEVALAENPTLVNARESEVASRFAIAVAKGALMPVVSVVGQISHNEESSIASDQTDEKSVVARVTIPLYQGGAEYARVRRAKQVDNQSLIAIVNADRQVRQGVANAWQTYLSAKAQVVSDKESVRANEIAYDGVRQEAQVGSRTTLDVLNAEQELLNARVSLVTSQRNSYVAGYQLLAAVGRLTAQKIGLPVKLYDPDVYYRKVHNKLIGWDIGTRE